VSAPTDRAFWHHDLTQFEIDGLTSAHNLADAHAHQGQSPGELEIVKNLLPVWNYAQKATQAAIDDEFLRTFFSFHGQRTVADDPSRSFISYSASIAMMIVATYLRLRRRSVTLIEPCFDNLFELLSQNEITIHPIDEAIVFESPDVISALLAQDTGDALVIVDPNNPSGRTSFTDDGRRFREIVEFCRSQGKILVVDFSFASFLRVGRGRPDVYSALDESGVTYMTIEDTGKTWPTCDLKCGILTVSRDIQQDIQDLHTGVLLNVSPFALALITKFVSASVDDGFRSVASLLAKNRATLVDALQGSAVEHLAPAAPVSVAWCRLHRGTATEVQAVLAAEGVHVLPGTHFFWSNHERGQSYIRMALARDPCRFAESVDVARAVLSSW
jgi:aspartate/methionine/tyrosine aminotransferase